MAALRRMSFICKGKLSLQRITMYAVLARGFWGVLVALAGLPTCARSVAALSLSFSAIACDQEQGLSQHAFMHCTGNVKCLFHTTEFHCLHAQGMRVHEWLSALTLQFQGHALQINMV